VGWYTEHVLPRVFDRTLGSAGIGELRAPVLAGLAGTVVEVGFGSGPNLPYYPATVDRVLAVEPSAVSRRLAGRRIATAHAEVEFVGLDGAALDLPDGSVDHAVSTWTLCSIPDLRGALAELYRVLVPGGTLAFLEHGLSPDPRVARWQHRMSGFQQRAAGGCHPERDITALVLAAGFEPGWLANRTLPGPRYLGYLHTGQVVRPIAPEPPTSPST
jgi:SAM-dependent methyltransferase